MPDTAKEVTTCSLISETVFFFISILWVFQNERWFSCLFLKDLGHNFCPK